MKKMSKLLVFAFTMIAVLAMATVTFGATNQSTSKTFTNASKAQRAAYEAEVKSIFDYEYYAAMNEDVRVSCGITEIDEMTDKQKDKLWQHFWYSGMYETRQPSAAFNVNAYASGYGDLRAAYGTDILAYYHHYVVNVVSGAEARTMTTIEKCGVGGFDVYDVRTLDKGDKATLLKKHYYAGWKHYAGSCYTTALGVWNYYKPAAKADMAELKIAYDSAKRCYYSTTDASKRALTESDAVYRQYLDRLIPMLDEWYATAPDPKAYSDTLESYKNYLNAKPDIAALGVKYSVYYDTYYVPGTEIGVDTYNNLSAAGKAAWVYVGDDKFAAVLDSNRNKTANLAIWKWSTYKTKPCVDYKGDQRLADK